MKNRGIWILLALVVILGGLSFWDFHVGSKEEEKKKQEAQLITLKRDQVSGLDIQTQELHVKMTKGPEGWRLEEPVQDLADERTVEEFLGSAQTEKSADVVREGDDIDWKVFGLDQPKGVFTWISASGERQSLAISATQNFEFQAYVRRGEEKKVLTASSSWQSKLDKKLIDYRTKSLFRHKVGNIDAIQINNTSGEIDLKKGSEKWRLTQEPSWILDESKIGELKDSLYNARVSEYLGKQKDLKSFGIHQPIARVMVKLVNQDTKEGLLNWEMRIGKVKEVKYAFLSETGEVYRLEPVALTQILDAQKKDLRDRSLPFRIEPEKVQKIELATEIKSGVLERTQGPDAGEWKLIGDNTSQWEVNQSLVQELSQKIKGAKVREYSPKLKGSPKPKLENHITLKGEKGEPILELSWSTKVLDKEKSDIYLAKSNLFPDFFTLDKNTISGLGLQDLIKDKPQQSPAR